MIDKVKRYDKNMIKITSKQQKIILILLEKSPLSSSDIHKELKIRGEQVSLVTIKRELSKMALLKLLEIKGSGPSTRYEVSVTGRIYADIDAKSYCVVETDKRFGSSHFNFNLLSDFPADLFSTRELQTLTEATREYRQRIAKVSDTIQKKELERLIIELSWKSSRIEGNTYTLLETEKLILENKKAQGHSKSEAQMILNHKAAFTFIHENTKFFKKLTRANLDHLHALIVKDLNIGKGFRKKPVGILGSKYRPPDNIHQINDAVADLSQLTSKLKSPYAKSLVALLGISYIQPFEDGNKRCARLMANALLMAHGGAPLSYRSVDENEYREATLVFYEINSIVPFKKIFIAQYDFAAHNYTLK